MGLEIEQEPTAQTFVVNVPYANLLETLDAETMFSLRLVQKNTNLENTSIYVTRRTTGEECVLVISGKDKENSFVSLSSLYYKSNLEQTNSKNSNLLRKGLVKNLRGRFKEDYPFVKFDEIQSRNDMASIEAQAYSIRKSRSQFSLIRESFVKLTNVPRYLLFALATLIALMIALGLAYNFVVFANFDFGNFLDIEVLLFIGILIDIGFAARESLEIKGENKWKTLIENAKVNTQRKSGNKSSLEYFLE